MAGSESESAIYYYFNQLIALESLCILKCSLRLFKFATSVPPKELNQQFEQYKFF